MSQSMTKITNYGEPDFGKTLFGDNCQAETIEIDGVLHAHYTPTADFQIPNDKQDPYQLQAELYVPFNNQEPYLEIRHPDPNRKYEDLTYHAGDDDMSSNHLPKPPSTDAST